jgi:predicted phosphodiesterase
MRVLILSDIHANLDALNCVLEDAKNKYDILISLGDIVGYGPCPNECVEIIAERAHISLAGNHDLGICNKINTDNFSPRAQYSQNWTSEIINDSSLTYLKSLHPTAPYEDIFLSHGNPNNPIWGYVFSQLDAILAFAGDDFSRCFFGHTHVPSSFLTACTIGVKTPIKIKPGKVNSSINTKKRSKRIMLNPGSVGFPRSQSKYNDKKNSYECAEYALFNLESGKWQFKQARYDVTKTRQLMAENGLR